MKENVLHTQKGFFARIAVRVNMLIVIAAAFLMPLLWDGLPPSA